MPIISVDNLARRRGRVRTSTHGPLTVSETPDRNQKYARPRTRRGRAVRQEMLREGRGAERNLSLNDSTVYSLERLGSDDLWTTHLS